MEFKLDASAADGALARLADRLEAAEPRSLRGTNPESLLISLSILFKSISDDELDRIRRLDGVLGFDMGAFVVAQDCANAMLDTLNKRDALRPTSNRRVEPATIEAAETLRARMLRLLAYHLDDDPKVATRLELIRAGQGHIDTARDLQKLAALYEEYTAQIQGDTRRYQAADIAEAYRLATAILGERTDSPKDDDARLADRQLRLTAVLNDAYAEIAAAAHFALRDSVRAKAFSSLYTLARSV